MESGKVLPIEVQEIVREFLNLDDYHDVAVESGYSFSTVNNLVNRKNVVTDTNKVCIIHLLEKCLEKLEEVNAKKNEVKRLLKQARK